MLRHHIWVSVGRGLRSPPAAIKALIFLTAVVYYTTAGFMYFEMPERPELRWIDALWWSIVTMSTVGFGDYFPVTTGGRLLVGVPAMMVGVAVFGYSFSQAAVFFMRAEAYGRKGFRVQKLDDAILICNYPSRPRFLRVLAEIRSQPELETFPVVLVDEHLEALDQDLAQDNVHFVRGHPGRTHALTKANIQHATRAVILARDPRESASDNFSLAIALAIRDLAPKLRIVAECVDPENEEILRRGGCEGIVCVLNLAPSILAHELHDPGLVDVLHELTVWHERENNIFIVPVRVREERHPEAHELRAWAQQNQITILGVRRGDKIVLNPQPHFVIEPRDQIVLMGAKRPSHVDL